MVAQRQPGDDGMLLNRQQRQHGLPVLHPQLLWQQGQRGFGCHHQRTYRDGRPFNCVHLTHRCVNTPPGEPQRIVGQRTGHARTRLKLFVLRNVALQQHQRQFTHRLREAGQGALHRRAQRQHGQHTCQRHRSHSNAHHPTTPGVRQAHCQTHGQRTHAVHAYPRRSPAQAVDMRISHRAPRETGEPHPTSQFRQRPERRKKQSTLKPPDKR
jgi:hypothetical protein